MDKALLVGIDHYDFERQLFGCVNDVHAVEDFLIERCGFSSGAIEMILETKATQRNVLAAVQRLVMGVAPGDRVIFHFSGHGSQLPTLDQVNEPDYLDEIICPVDYRAEVGNGIRDRDFRRIFAAVPPGVRFVCIADSCSSGDLVLAEMLRLDIRNVLPTPEAFERIQIARRRGLRPVTFIGAAKDLNLALLSACGANATAHETVINGVTRGVFTYALLERLSMADGFVTQMPKVIDDVAQRTRAVSQKPEIEGAEANKRMAFPGRRVVTGSRNSLATNPFGAGASPRHSSSLAKEEDVHMARPLCLAEYDAVRLPNGLVIVTATGSNPAPGYVVDFELVEHTTNTFRLVHTAPNPPISTDQPFTKTLTLMDFEGTFVRMFDASGPRDIPIATADALAVAAAKPLMATDNIGRGGNQ